MESPTIDIVTLTSSDPKFLDSISEVLKQSGETESAFLGKKVESDGIFKIFIARKQPFLGLRLDYSTSLVTTWETKIHSISFETTTPQILSNILKAPAIELVRFSDPKPPFSSLFGDFLAEFCAPAPGCLGAVIGWELDEDGFTGRKTCVGLLGWNSVEHHMAATKKEGFEEAAGKFTGEVTGGAGAWHVQLKELTNSVK